MGLKPKSSALARWCDGAYVANAMTISGACCSLVPLTRKNGLTDSFCVRVRNCRGKGEHCRDIRKKITHGGWRVKIDVTAVGSGQARRVICTLRIPIREKIVLLSPHNVTGDYRALHFLGRIFFTLKGLHLEPPTLAQRGLRVAHDRRRRRDIAASVTVQFWYPNVPALNTIRHGGVRYGGRTKNVGCVLEESK
ncbi:hypothetical protein EVAR_20349_1 [Eumeta japonica]|uniref:Uncharacterized protein n=1 Tax=Eumeta variegata TaxID=151549 RepID=A0A4C1VS74_EUMVA|nr:hypothetical protein EVAR_20349_1 [Eumeta japonica]